MKGLSPSEQSFKDIFDAQAIPAMVCTDEWGEAYLSVPVTVDDQTTRSARFGLIEDGQPVLTELPRSRYLCIRVPRFYQWWESLYSYPDVLQEANAIANSLMQRDAYPDFYISYTDNDIICFALNIPLGEQESLHDAAMDAYHQLSAIAKAVYAYLKKYDEDYDEDEEEASL